MNYELIWVEKNPINPEECVLTVRRQPSRLQRHLDAAEPLLRFTGRGTEWHSANGTSPDAELEDALNQFWLKHAPKDVVQEALEESFPASDPPPWTLGRSERPADDKIA